MTEEWRAVQENSGNYEVSSEGRVRSLPHLVPCKTPFGAGFRTSPGIVLKSFIAKKTGYLQVTLSGVGRRNVHRLVAAAFCDAAGGNVVNHLNGEKQDNRAINLEWTTYAGNLRHSFEKLGRKGSCLGRFGADHPTSLARRNARRAA